MIKEKLEERCLFKSFDNNNINLDEKQREAIEMIFKSNISILNGGAGTGKTFTVNQIIKEYNNQRDDSICLLAPTGKASKRMTEMTNLPAQTIHRKINLFDEEAETEEIIEDFIIVDESSMMDAFLFFKLLECVREDAKILLVGDFNQLPSVGAGLILRDLIESGVIQTTTLTKIFRQSEESKIFEIAYNISHDLDVDLVDTNDFIFIEKETDEEIMNEILKNYDNKNSQVLSLMRKGVVGTNNLNNVIQSTFNSKSLVKFNSSAYKIGDKVIQNVNNYDLGVFNGESGVITQLNEELIVVDFGDKEIEYLEDNINEIQLAYAITVHKSQGSEWDTVIIPISKNNKIMNNKNLIYTAITRAKNKVIIIGSKAEFLEAIKRVENLERNSRIKEKLNR